MERLFDPAELSQRQSQLRRPIPCLQGAHDASGWNPAQFERTSQTQEVVPVRFNSAKGDALSCNRVEFTVVWICINAPEARGTNVNQAGTEPIAQKPVITTKRESCVMQERSALDLPKNRWKS
jgi:hypothetical protein